MLRAIFGNVKECGPPLRSCLKKLN